MHKTNSNIYISIYLSNNKVVRPRHDRGECKPCISRSDCQCCRQLKQTTTFSSKTTYKSFYIRYKLNCKSSRVIYLMDCLKCGKQYVGKSETPFNIRLSNQRKDVNSMTNALSVSHHFRQADHSFNQDAKFTLIEQIKNNKLDPMKAGRTLEDHEDFWILRLNILKPHGLNDKLNHPENATGSLY